ncbi:hypothetical protein WMY93_003449 [Mugilogobius chulae]|uniref:Uncharacterized protein n=1 Tax=Mugilogobius chulae TaxID=88201 RepID=A0AAW0PYC0_9GOBI
MAAVDSFQFLYKEIARTCSFYYDTLALVGALYTASKAVILLKKLLLTCQNGATPVALAYAEELARQGVSIIFITENPDAVRDIAASLPPTYGVETVVILADFSSDQSALKLIQEAIRGKDIGFLINCVEEALTQPQNFTEVSEVGLMQVVNKATTVMTLMTRLVLPGMLQQSRGAVVNISPGVCCRPLPGRVMLTASMGFLDHFSQALHLEYGGKGIFVQSLIPFQIASTRGRIREGWFTPKPQVYVQHAISTLGVSHRTSGYWPHTLQCGLINCIPDWMWVFGTRLFIS